MLFTARKLALLAALGSALCLPAAALTRCVPALPAEVGFYENLGGVVPLDTAFRDENGAAVILRQLIHTPTILALVYYKCPNVCDYLLMGVAGSLKSLDAAAGTDYQVITVSIDETETSADARKAKRIALETIQKPFPPAAWRFLTGNAASIDLVAQATGYRFVKRDNGFDHPVGIIILSGQGKIIRYMYGADFLPADLKLSLLEASEGRIGPTIAKVLRICFTRDPKSHALVFNILRIVGTVTLLSAGAFIGYLVFAGLKRKRAARQMP
ncbi:MAG TPA: SCO family protein [Spirochaetia bacterium]|nr:SCO family protein [Spirochaetia bacterium]